MKSLTFDDVVLVPAYNDIASRKDVDTTTQFGNLILGIPILSSNMDTITDAKMARTIYHLGGYGFLHRFCSIEDNIKMYQDIHPTNLTLHGVRRTDGAVSLGINEGLDRFHALYEIGARFFCVDVAHGHSKAVGKFVQKLKNAASDTTIIAGNVCTYAGADYLASCGADIIKVGIGPGSHCSTRVQTGFGVSQFSAIIECARVSKPIIADGGIRSGGDAVKAFVAGASYIMCGGLLGGTDETPGKVINGDNNKQYKVVRGMASREAAEDYFGQLAEWKTAEGVQSIVPCKGPVANVIKNLMGGIRSGMTYAGARTLNDLKRKVEWREISHASYIEGTPHGKI
jgi:IMP dehydrogenase